MDTYQLRKAMIVMGIGFVFEVIYSFIYLTGCGYPYAQEVLPAIYIGFALITAGAYIFKGEHKYFKACLITFLCLDAILLAFVIFGKSAKGHLDGETYNLVLNIFMACLNAALALGNGLFITGLKELFGKRKNNRMFAYSLTMEYGVTGLLLISTILGFFSFENQQSELILTCFNLALNVIIQGSYAVYTFVVAHFLKEKKVKHKNK